MNELNPQRGLGDIYLVALLLAYKIRPVRVDRSHPKYQKFIFNEHLNSKFWIMNDEGMPELMPMDLSELETYYFAKQLLYPGTYPEALKEIKVSLQSTMV